MPLLAMLYHAGLLQETWFEMFLLMIISQTYSSLCISANRSVQESPSSWAPRLQRQISPHWRRPGPGSFLCTFSLSRFYPFRIQAPSRTLRVSNLVSRGARHVRKMFRGMQLLPWSGASLAASNCSHRIRVTASQV